MKVHVSMTALATSLAVAGLTSFAVAQEPMEEEQYQQQLDEEPVADEPSQQQRQGYSPVRPSVFAADAAQPRRPTLVTPIGMSATLGGGLTGFTASRAREFSDVGGGWNARLVVGTRSMIAGEVAYIGSVQDINAIGLDPGAQLLANGGEVLGRVNFLPGMFQPYVLAGAGYVNYNVVNNDFNTSSINNSDNLVQFPIGAGMAFRYEGLVVDARGTFRPTVEGDLFANGENGMQSWGTNLSAGFEF